MRRATFIGLAAAAVGAGILPDAEAATERRSLSAFHALSIDGAARLDVTEGPTQSVVATAPPAVLKRLQLTVSNGVLRVGIKSGSIFEQDDKPLLVITTPTLDSVTVGGVASGTVRGLTGPAFRLVIRGAGSITLAGSVAKADLAVSGTGSVDARRLLAQDLTVDISGAGSLHAYARRSADIVVDGVGSATIAGNPPTRKVARNGVGSITFD